MAVAVFDFYDDPVAASSVKHPAPLMIHRDDGNVDEEKKNQLLHVPLPGHSSSKDEGREHANLHEYIFRQKITDKLSCWLC